jgi:hypothetical protein
VFAGGGGGAFNYIPEVYKICDDGMVIILFLEFIHHPIFLFKTHHVSETGFCLRLQVKSIQLGPIDRASPYLRNIMCFK